MVISLTNASDWGETVRFLKKKTVQTGPAYCQVFGSCYSRTAVNIDYLGNVKFNNQSLLFAFRRFLQECNKNLIAGPPPFGRSIGFVLLGGASSGAGAALMHRRSTAVWDYPGITGALHCPVTGGEDRTQWARLRVPLFSESHRSRFRWPWGQAALQAWASNAIWAGDASP